MLSKPEQIIQAVLARLETLPTTKVERNAAVPEHIPAGGLIVLRDGNPGDPDTALGGFGGSYSHVFASGNDTLPSYSIEVGMGQVPAFFMHAGVMLNSIVLEFQRSGAAVAESGVLEGLAPREGG